jgi:hypothetical protein
MQLMPLVREIPKFNLAQAWSITENSDRDLFEPIVVVDEVQFTDFERPNGPGGRPRCSMAAGMVIVSGIAQPMVRNLVHNALYLRDPKINVGELLIGL